MITLREKILVLLHETRPCWQAGAAPSRGGSEVYQPESFVSDSLRRRYQKSSLRQRLWEMSCRGELKRVAREGQKWLVLTAKGETVVRQKVPALSGPAGRAWDGSWRWLFLDGRGVAPRWRFLLARQLLAAGFGRWRSTLWVSPFPLETEIKGLLAEEALRGKVVVWEAKRAFGLAESEVAARVWPLNKLNQAYAALGREWEEGQRNYGQSVEVIKKLAASLQERYLTLLCADPGLPAVLLPSDWWGGPVKKLLPEWARAVY